MNKKIINWINGYLEREGKGKFKKLFEINNKDEKEK